LTPRQQLACDRRCQLVDRFNPSLGAIVLVADIQKVSARRDATRRNSCSNQPTHSHNLLPTTTNTSTTTITMTTTYPLSIVAPFVVPLPFWFPTKPTADTSIVTRACGIINICTKLWNPLPPRRLVVKFVGLVSPRVDQQQQQQTNNSGNQRMAGWLRKEAKQGKHYYLINQRVCSS
jgi:hypothetical protein